MNTRETFVQNTISKAKWITLFLESNQYYQKKLKSKLLLNS